MHTIDVKRIEEDIYKIAEYGTVPGERGMYRQGFTEADWQSRQWLLDYFRQFKLSQEVDQAKISAKVVTTKVMQRLKQGEAAVGAQFLDLDAHGDAVT